MTISIDSSDSAGLPATAPIPLRDGSYIGEVRMFAANVVPPGWLILDGREFDSSAPDTKQLGLVLGTLWGSTKKGWFRIPDLRGQFVRGWNQGRGAEDGGDPDAGQRELPPGAPNAGDPAANRDQVGSRQVHAFQTHGHTVQEAVLTTNYTNNLANGGHYGAVTGTASVGGQTSVVDYPVRVAIGGPTGNSSFASAETRPQNVYLVFAIRNALP